MNVTLDFNYDDDVIDLYTDSLNHEYTREFSSGELITRELASKRLHGVSKSKRKSGYDVLGILKITSDDNELLGMSFPRRVIAEEYNMYGLKAINKYYKLNGIYIKEEARGYGLASMALKWLIDNYGYVVWVADRTNTGSIKVARSAGLYEISPYENIDSKSIIFSN